MGLRNYCFAIYTLVLKFCCTQWGHLWLFLLIAQDNVILVNIKKGVYYWNQHNILSEV